MAPTTSTHLPRPCGSVGQSERRGHPRGGASRRGRAMRTPAAGKEWGPDFSHNPGSEGRLMALVGPCKTTDNGRRYD